MRHKIKTAILISGGGSNMEALINASKARAFPAKIVLVICNQPKAGGIERAKKLGIPVLVVDHKAFGSREEFEREMHVNLLKHHVELICNAGFMRILTPWFVRRWLGKQINIHPSLLPKYKGLHTHKRAIEAGDKEHGCTIHYVNEGVDDGKILAQARIPLLPTDTPQTLAERVLIEEHKLYPKTLKRVAMALRLA
ncbi:MAG: phosphoribosylglycinamide formyltransferase [Robiginitomaculum sp.]|nr:phosphoribosylglycinamide formyltransferase [Robiginitomaculum sp.]